MITRVIAIENLREHIGSDLSAHAQRFGIVAYKGGKQNKGWKGLTLERLAGLNSSNERAPNGLDFELKSTAFHLVGHTWEPKETFAITMLNQNDLVTTSFFSSHCWEKLKSLIYCAVSWHGKNAQRSELLKVESFDFLKSDTLIKEIEADYEFIRRKLINEGYSALTGGDGKWIQARTKGPGHGSISRAFYARKGLIKKIINL